MGKQRRFAAVMGGFLTLFAAYLLVPVDSLDLDRAQESTELPIAIERLSDRQANERDASIKDGQGSRIYWFGDRKRTALSIVYLHGFSASPLELEPTVQNLATALGANLYTPRFRGHGLRNSAEMAQARAEDWLNQAREALAIGHAIGNRVVVIGMSTGASLALLATDTLFRKSQSLLPDALILLSPNFRVQAAGSELLMTPFGARFARLLLSLVIGSENQFPVENRLHEERWTSRYPVEGIVQLMRVMRALERVNLSSPAFRSRPTLVVYTHKDTVVSTAEIERRVREFDSATTTVQSWDKATRHQLVSRAFDPEYVDQFVDLIRSWIESI